LKIIGSIRFEQANLHSIEELGKIHSGFLSVGMILEFEVFGVEEIERFAVSQDCLALRFPFEASVAAGSDHSVLLFCLKTPHPKLLMQSMSAPACF